MTDDNWSLEMHPTQLKLRETLNQSNCVVSTLPNDSLASMKWSYLAPVHQPPSLDEVIFGTRRSTPSLTHSLTPTINQAIHQPTSIKPSLPFRNDNLHLSTHLTIHTFTHWRNHSFVRSFTLTISHIHSLTWLVTHFIMRSLTHPHIYSNIRYLSQLFTPSRYSFMSYILPNYSCIHPIANSQT